jgi:hypothetical protein
MSIQVLTNQKVFFDGYDITGVTNAIALSTETETKDATTLGNDTRKNVASLKTVAASVEGFEDPAVHGAILFTNVGLADKVLTFGNAATEGSLAYFFKALQANYSQGGAVGELHTFSAEAIATGKLIRGTILANKSAATSSSFSEAQQLGAVSSSQKVWAALHVLSASESDTLDVVIESDAADDFSGSETTRITFDQVNAIGSQFKQVSGAITDTWWRSDFTIAGADPSFSFIVVIGIQS